MRHLVMTAALLVSFDISLAVAQTSSSKASSGGASQQQMREAPIGHRQPRASDFASEKNAGDPKDSYSKEDAELARRLKSICRGC